MFLEDPDFNWRQQSRNPDGSLTLPILSPMGGDEIIIKTQCDECNHWVYEKISAPQPLFASEGSTDNDAFFDTFCDNCENPIEIHVINNIGGIMFEINDRDEEAIYYLPISDRIDVILSLINSFINFTNEIQQLKIIANMDFNIDEEHDVPEDEPLPPSLLLQNTMNHMYYSTLVTIMEAYFYNVFMYNVTQHEKILNRFVHLYFHKKIFTFYSIFWNRSKLIEQIKKGPGRRAFHNVDIIKTIMNDAFGVGLPNNENDIRDIVEKRHDIVHRNGYTKAREPVMISNYEIINAIECVEKFVGDLDKDINKAIKRIIR